MPKRLIATLERPLEAVRGVHAADLARKYPNFATHLLERGQDIRTIQELPGPQRGAHHVAARLPGSG